MPRAPRSWGGAGGAASLATLLCPPQAWCLERRTALLLGCAVAVLAVATLIAALHLVRAPAPHYAPHPAPAPAPAQQPRVVVVNRALGPRELGLGLPSLAPPERLTEMPADPGPVWTRGLPERYQQVGLLVAAGGGPDASSSTRTLLPLYGRRTDVSRDRWNYYTRTDGTNPVSVPVTLRGQSCDNDTGCDVALDGDSAAVPLLGRAFTVSIYRQASPRYLPNAFA
jgi:hypothetical protein